MEVNQEKDWRSTLKAVIPFVIMFYLCIASCTNSAITRVNNCRGTLSGTIGSMAVDKFDEEAFDVPRAKTELLFKKTMITVVEEENGDYYGTSLECGNYKLNRIIAEDGTLLHTIHSQPMQFSVYKNKDTRFDIAVLRTINP